ncbi:MAG: hypothetical protein OJJ54_19080 [Pseudonocardia sp.]|nr:hypothetical protein [Pseudonocardia sp.]
MSLLNVLARAAALGAASGGRSTAGLTAVTLTSRARDPWPARYLAGPVSKVSAVLSAGGEAVADKLPGAPPRTAPAGLAPRVAFGAAAAAIATRRGGTKDPQVVGGAAALAAALSVAAAFAGTKVRGIAAERFGADLPGALAEDGLVGTLAWWGSRR